MNTPYLMVNEAVEQIPSIIIGAPLLIHLLIVDGSGGVVLCKVKLVRWV